MLTKNFSGRQYQIRILEPRRSRVSPTRLALLCAPLGERFLAGT
jgi:hypothetical protein